MQRLVFDQMPFRVLYLAELPTHLDSPVWSPDRTEAYRFDHYADADSLAQKIRAHDMHVHALVLDPARDPRRPVQMQLAIPEAQAHRAGKKPRSTTQPRPTHAHARTHP